MLIRRIKPWPSAKAKSYFNNLAISTAIFIKLFEIVFYVSVSFTFMGLWWHMACLDDVYFINMLIDSLGSLHIMTTVKMLMGISLYSFPLVTFCSFKNRISLSYSMFNLLTNIWQFFKMIVLLDNVKWKISNFLLSSQTLLVYLFL